MHKLIYLILTLGAMSSVMATPIEIVNYKQQKSIRQLVKLQKAMSMSEDPKKLSTQPQAICFRADISDFLTNNSQNKPIFGCVFSDQVAMNASLLRAGLFIHTKMGMASDANLFGSNLMGAVGGHDFDGEELLRYNMQSVIPSESLPEHKVLKEIESEFDTKIIKPIISTNGSNFIFFAIVNTKKYQENLSHELLHAQYYNVPQIRTILLEVWNNVSPTDKNIIINALREGGYDVEQEELLLREFYSYFLQFNAKTYLANIKVLAPMSEFADIYAPKIKSALAKHNIQVLVVN